MTTEESKIPNLKRPRSTLNSADRNHDEILQQQDKCWKCHGRGHKYNKGTKLYDGDICGVCSGSGKRKKSKKSEVLSNQKGKILRLRGHPSGQKFFGPPAVGRISSLSVKVNTGEILASLGCGDWRLVQLANGHKLTVDDFICAYVASLTMRERGYGPKEGMFGTKPTKPSNNKLFKHADLGCGCGSVLMTLAWAFPESILSHGVEAQAVSFSLCKRGLAFNLGESQDIVRLSHDDFRNWEGGDRQPFDLITGTPPYFPLSRFIASENVAQKIRCRVPTRGAAADYIQAAARLLTSDGIFVMVETARKEGELGVLQAAEKFNLKILKVVDVITKENLPPRFSCWVMSRNDAKKSINDFERTTFTLRDKDNKRTLEYRNAMHIMGWVDFENEEQHTEPVKKKSYY